MKLIQGDCLEEMDKLIEEDVKVDLVLTDIPYGTTLCKWDEIIPFEDMWKCIHGLVKERTPILLFGNEPFSSLLRVSNINEYKYDWVWNKENASNFAAYKYMPLKPLEYISVFYEKAPYFNPIRRKKTIDYDGTRTGKADKEIRWKGSEVNGLRYKRRYYVDDGMRHTINLLTYNNQKGECNNYHRVHPTQKPVPLLEYFIKTYTHPDDVVLDLTMGSGSTGVAAKGLGRDFIGIELDSAYYEIACDRIKNVQKKLVV